MARLVPDRNVSARRGKERNGSNGEAKLGVVRRGWFWQVNGSAFYDLWVMRGALEMGLAHVRR